MESWLVPLTVLTHAASFDVAVWYVKNTNVTFIKH